MARDVDIWGCNLPQKQVEPETWFDLLLSGALRIAINTLFIGVRSRPDGWRCQNRRVDGHWILLVLEGHSEGRAGGKTLKMGPGDAMWITPGTVHELKWSAPIRYSEVYFAVKRDVGGSGFKYRHHFSPHDGLIVAPEAGSIARLLDRIADEAQFGGAYTLIRLRAQLAELCVDMMRLAGYSDPRSTYAPGRNKGLAHTHQLRLIKLVRERGYHLTPADLAAALDLSPDYFSRQFRASFGMSPRVWLNRQQLEAAAAMLDHTDVPIYTIADQLGYAGVAQFSRQFKRVIGTSPAAYRRRKFPAE